MTSVQAGFRFYARSLGVGDSLRLIVDGDAAELANVNVDITRVGESYDDFALGTSAVAVRGSAGYVVDVEPVKGLNPGVYIAVLRWFPSQDSAGLFLQPADGNPLFEIREDDVPIRTAEALAKAYRDITERRLADFTSGFGGVYRQTDRSFLGLVFIRDCLVTRKMKLGRYEVIPWRGMAIQDEVELVQSFLKEHGFGSLDNLEKTLAQAERGQPTAVVHFPNVRASDVAAAGEVAEHETRLLCDLLAIQRNGYGSVYASVVRDPDGFAHFRFHTPHYRGNLLGGSLSGEEPAVIRDRMSRLRGDESIQLYVSLFRDALQEKELGYQYLRYWTVLEIMARHLRLVGEPRAEWNSRPVENRRGLPVFIQDSARELVFEFLRRTLVEDNVESAVAPSWSDDIDIWYRNRNCVAHGGTCLCRDRVLDEAEVTERHRACRKAHDEVVAQRGARDSFTDSYLRDLRETVSLALGRYLSGKVD